MYKLKNIAYILIIFVSIFIFDSIAYAYKTYSIGDVVAYNDIEFYVIKGSNSEENTVTLLKAEPLSYEEVQTYSDGTGARTYDRNGYGGMEYHASSSAYNGSYVKTTVEAWAQAKAPAATEARLITLDEVKNLGYEWGSWGVSDEGWLKTEDTPTWLYNENYWYWTMSPYNDASSDVWSVFSGGALSNNVVSDNNGVVRPVITLKKSAIEKDEEEIIDDDTDKENDKNISNETKEIVNVPNTLQKISIISIMIGVILISISIVIVIKNRK